MSTDIKIRWILPRSRSWKPCRRHCKEVMFEYNHTSPADQEKRQELLKGLLGRCDGRVFIEDGVHMSYGCISFWRAVFTQISI